MTPRYLIRLSGYGFAESDSSAYTKRSGIQPGREGR